jgi:cysteine peptidase C11 family protein
MSSANKWTIMFFFASDNALSPLLVSELKAIKDAGFQENTEVLVYFDPVERGAPTHVYNVNLGRKLKKKTFIGDGKDSFVRKMDEDVIDPKEVSTSLQAVLNPQSSASASDALKAFVEFGRSRNSDNYILYLVGHGMIVGNDAFLPDSDPVSAISLRQLKEILQPFKDGGKSLLRLLALHSCAMSSVEVAYELQGCGDFMMATQGNAFVNAWPYRQLLKKTFNTIDKARRDQVNVQQLVEKLFFHCVSNATDFVSAGYSADLSLVNLQSDKLQRLRGPIQNLVKKLKEHLSTRVDRVKDMVELAHWEAQSFFEENYSDLYDFCFCLSRRCMDEASYLQIFQPPPPIGAEPEAAPTTPLEKWISDLQEVASVCDKVTEALAIAKGTDISKRFDNIVIHEENFGAVYQYARGLSVYFPWSEPLDDDPVARRARDRDCTRRDRDPSKSRSLGLLENYASYRFTTDFGDDSWLSFLTSYWANTKRLSRFEEEGEGMFSELFESENTIAFKEIDTILNRIGSEFNDAVLAEKKTPELKKTPEEGADCTCPSIKNYPTDPRRRTKRFSITPGALRSFLPIDSEEEGDGQG